ncbi:ImpA family metalloprotease [Leptothrix sp. BB-4]
MLAGLSTLVACGGGQGTPSNGSATPPAGSTVAAPDSIAQVEPSNPEATTSEPVSGHDKSVLNSRGIERPRSSEPMPYFSGRTEQADYTLASGLDEPGEIDDSLPVSGPALATAQAVPQATSAAADPGVVLARLRSRVTQMSGAMDRHLQDLFLDQDGHLLDTGLSFTQGSISFPPSPGITGATVIPLAWGKSRQMMGYGFEHPEGAHGRGLVYGADVLNWMTTGSREVRHRPLLRSAWRWALPASAITGGKVRYATHNYSAATVKTYVTDALGMSAEAVTCDLTAATLASTCDGMDVFVIGGGIDDGLVTRQRIVTNVRTLLSAGKSVMYFAPSTWNNSGPGTNALLFALGEASVSYPGNYFWCPDACESATVGSFEQVRADFNLASRWVDLLAMLDGTLAIPDVVTNRRPIELIDWAHDALRQFQARDISVLNQRGGRDLLRLLVAWADAWRPQVVYGASIDKSVNRLAFLRAYASDSWIQNNRRSLTLPAQGAGDYTPALAAREMRPGTEAEDIDVTIAQSDGITLIGRAAVPGQAVEIEVVTAGSSTALAVQTSYLRAWGNPMSFDAGSPGAIRYQNPRRPGSWPVPLKTGEVRHFISPFGGPLMLTYNGAKPGDVVKLRLRGAATYAHIDFTQPTPVTQAQIDEMATRISNDVLDWMSFKFVGGEVQQKIPLSRFNWVGRSLSDYLRYALQDDVFQVNHRANGYRNVTHSPTVAALCAQFAWDCTSNLHRAPGVQHFVGWIATCGSLCSGQPVDAYGGFSAGWGTAHELGHNTVQRVHTISFTEPDFDTGLTVNKGCYTECNNNILSVVTGMAVWAREGRNIGSGRVGTRKLYVDILQPARAEAIRRGLTPEQTRLMTGTRLWVNGSEIARWSLHFQLGALYAKYRHPDSPIVEREMMFDFLRMLTMGDRLVSADWSTANASRYAMGRYASNAIGNQDLVYVLSSKIIGRDLRRIFALYGIPLSSTAMDSVADLGLPVAPLAFYAFPDYAPADGVWLDLEAASWPVYPFGS